MAGSNFMPELFTPRTIADGGRADDLCALVMTREGFNNLALVLEGWMRAWERYNQQDINGSGNHVVHTAVVLKQVLDARLVGNAGARDTRAALEEQSRGARWRYLYDAMRDDVSRANMTPCTCGHPGFVEEGRCERGHGKQED